MPSISMKDTKMITIESRGRYMSSRGPVFGPVRQPYREKINTIFGMLGAGATIKEHLANGTCVTLNMTNYNKDNTNPVDTTPEKASVKLDDVVPVLALKIEEDEPVKEKTKPTPKKPVKKSSDETTKESDLVGDPTKEESVPLNEDDKKDNSDNTPVSIGETPVEEVK